MAHGGYGKRRVAERKPHVGRRSKGMGVEKKPKPKSVSLKNQIRSTERMLRKVHFRIPFLPKSPASFIFGTGINPRRKRKSLYMLDLGFCVFNRLVLFFFLNIIFSSSEFSFYSLIE